MLKHAVTAFSGRACASLPLQPIPDASTCEDAAMTLGTTHLSAIAGSRTAGGRSRKIGDASTLLLVSWVLLLLALSPTAHCQLITGPGQSPAAAPSAPVQPLSAQTPLAKAEQFYRRG